MTWWRTSRSVRGCAQTVRGVLQLNPQEGDLFFEREQEREKEGDLGRVGEKGEVPACFHPAAWVPPARGTHGRSATSARTVCEERGRSGPKAQTVHYYFQNVQRCTSSPRAARTVRAGLADSPPGAAGRSGLKPRTVRPPLLILA
jgi:hypothetical protein